MYRVYFDLEFQVIKGLGFHEILSVGAVVVNQQFEIVEEFYQLVKPRHKLDKRVLTLTHLSSIELLCADEWPVVFEQLYRIHSQYPNATWWSFGSSDELAIRQMCREYRLSNFLKKKIFDFQHFLMENWINHYPSYPIFRQQISLKTLKQLYHHAQPQTSHQALQDAKDLVYVAHAFNQNQDLDLTYYRNYVATQLMEHCLPHSPKRETSSTPTTTSAQYLSIHCFKRGNQLNKTKNKIQFFQNYHNNSKDKYQGQFDCYLYFDQQGDSLLGWSALLVHQDGDMIDTFEIQNESPKMLLANWTRFNHWLNQYSRKGEVHLWVSHPLSCFDLIPLKSIQVEWFNHQMTQLYPEYDHPTIELILQAHDLSWSDKLSLKGNSELLLKVKEMLLVKVLANYKTSIS